MRWEEKRRRVKEQVESVGQWQRPCCLFLHFVCIRIVMHFDIRLRMARMESDADETRSVEVSTTIHIFNLTQSLYDGYSRNSMNIIAQPRARTSAFPAWRNMSVIGNGIYTIGKSDRR